jgi:hypothetical protein
MSAGGSLAKKHGLTVVSTKGADGERTYSIKPEPDQGFVFHAAGFEPRQLFLLGAPSVLRGVRTVTIGNEVIGFTVRPATRPVSNGRPGKWIR